MAQFDDGVAPGSRAEDVADIGDGVAEGAALFKGGEGVAEAAARPGWTGGKEGMQDGDCFLEDLFEGVDWGTAFAGVVGDGWDIVGDEMGKDFGGLGCVDCCDLAGGVDGLLDGGVLAVSSLLVGSSHTPYEACVQVVEWEIPMAKGWRRNDIHIGNGTFVHADVELFHLVVWTH